MKKHKKGHFLIYVLLAVMIGVGIGVWREFLSVSTVSQKEVADVFQKDSGYQYFYNQLKNDQKETYQRIYYVLSEHTKEISLDEEDIDIVKNIFTNVLYDHPEFYYVNGEFEYQQYRDTINFIPKYDLSASEVDKMNTRIDDKVSDFITSTQQLSSIEKAKEAYDYIAKNVIYQDESENNQNIISSLVNGKTVCAGYARAYQYILNRLGVESTYMTGVAKESNGRTLSGDGHAWVMVCIDGDYYYCDPTWGDVDAEGLTHVCYGYFMMNSTDMLRNYEPEVKYEKTVQEQYNYFKDNECYLETYSEKVLSSAVVLGLKNKSRVAEIKCANERIYQQVKTKLETTTLGHRILSQNHCWSESSTYSCIDELRLIELYY